MATVYHMVHHSGGPTQWGSNTPFG